MRRTEIDRKRREEIREENRMEREALAAAILGPSGVEMDLDEMELDEMDLAAMDEEAEVEDEIDDEMWKNADDFESASGVFMNRKADDSKVDSMDEIHNIGTFASLLQVVKLTSGNTRFSHMLIHNFFYF